MNFKKFIKKMNRGIALGIVFALAITIFVIVDEKRFDKEEELIRQTIEDYMKDYATLNIEVSSIITPGQKATATQTAQAKEKMSAFLSKYYTLGNINNGNGFYKDEIASAYDSYLANTVLPIITEQTFNIIDNNVSIRKNGPGAARISFSCEGKAKLKGNINVFFPGSRSFYSGDGIVYEYYSKPGYPSENTENQMSFDKLYLSLFSVSAQFYLSRTNEGWKIVMSWGNININYPSELTVKAADNNSLLLQKYIIPQSKKYIMGGQEI